MTTLEAFGRHPGNRARVVLGRRHVLSGRVTDQHQTQVSDLHMKVVANEDVGLVERSRVSCRPSIRRGQDSLRL
jgi:hypothetical protein